MKVNGVENNKKVTFGPLVFKRGENYLAFLAQPVWDYEDFHAKCPLPVNNNVVFTAKGKQTDDESPAYKVELDEYKRRRWGYTILKTLEPSNIELGDITLDTPIKWPLVEEALKQELAVFEFNALSDLIHEANALDNEKLEENAESFFQQQSQLGGQKKESSPKEEA